MSERIIIVDENDQVIGEKDRDDIDYSTDIYRASGIWITDAKGNILLAQRSLKKDKSPGLWGPAARGTVAAGESYVENAVKELNEEIGVRVSPDELQLGPKEFIVVKNPERRLYWQWFILVGDISIESLTLQTEEVETVEWFAPEELRKAATEHPENFIKNMLTYVEMFSTK